jgi:hypothetical protein
LFLLLSFLEKGAVMKKLEVDREIWKSKNCFQSFEKGLVLFDCAIDFQIHDFEVVSFASIHSMSFPTQLQSFSFQIPTGHLNLGQTHLHICSSQTCRLMQSGLFMQTQSQALSS